MKGIIQLLFFLPLLAGCASGMEKEQPGIGLLLTHTAEEQVWNEKGYEAVRHLEKELEADVYIRENIESPEDVREAAEELSGAGVELLFGHSAVYADLFMNIKDDFEDMHFVSFNEPVSGDNITSLLFEGYAMGYFAGMLAAEQSESGRVAAVGAFPYQPEIRGFSEGASYHESGPEVALRFTESWVDREGALAHLEELAEQGTDVVYAAGDGFHEEIMKNAGEKGIYTIGYIGDAPGSEKVLTSTVQHVEKLYEETAEAYFGGTLESGSRRVDFQDGFISLGTFGPAVDETTKQWLKEAVEKYNETGLLPHEQETQEGL